MPEREMIVPPWWPEAAQAAEGLTEELTRLRRHFHQHPELSHQERRTAAAVAAYLTKLGLEVKTGIAGHGVVGRLMGATPGRTVAWRADMDALPLTEELEVPWRSKNAGVMHACGHDFHLAIALGTAALLSRFRDRLSGEIRFLFQPAEEGPPQGPDSGALGMVRAGVLDNPRVDAIFGLHVAPTLDVGQVRYCPEVVMAGSEHLILTVTGQVAHGATPHKGVDPILAAAQTLVVLKSALAQEVDSRQPFVLTFGRITGGNRFNILADRVVLEGSLRFLSPGVRERVLAAVRRHLAGLAKATGARLELATQGIYPILKNDARLADRAVRILKECLGARRVTAHQPAMGSEDFAYFAQEVPAFYFFLGVRTPGTRGQALHAPDFNPDEAALPLGLKAAAALLLGTGAAGFR
jgi:amidohydrolase